MGKKLDGLLQIVFAIAVIILVVYYSRDLKYLEKYGYIGAFVISLASSATLFFPAPGWAVIIGLGKVLDPILLGIVAGLGSGIGELTGYIAGEGVREVLNDRIKESKQIHELVQKYDVVAIFFLAAIPNPIFDVAGIAAGGVKMEWWKFLLATIAGRIIRYVILAKIGSVAFG